MFLMPVNLYASLRKITHKKTIEFEMPLGETVNWLLVSLIDRYPEMHDKLLNEHGGLDTHAHVYINGRDCLLLENALETKLAADDTVDIFPIGHF